MHSCGARRHTVTTDVMKADPMTDRLDLDDLRHLARVAEGCGASLPEAAVARLILAGLVRRPEHRCEGAPEIELTPDGLALVRSSDQ